MNLPPAVQRLGSTSDITGTYVLDEVEKLLSDVSARALYTVIQDAHNTIRLPFDSAKELLTAAKVKKDVENREEEQGRFEEYEKAINDLADMKVLLSESMPALLEYEDEAKKRDKKNLKIAILIALLGLFFGSMITSLIN